MTKFESAFGGLTRVLLPVIHPVTVQDAWNSVEKAVSAGCRGFFLINQGLSTPATVHLFGEVSATYPSIWVGLNLLGYSPLEVAEISKKGIWADNCKQMVKGQWEALTFGGVAFKYQEEVGTLEEQVRAGLSSVDVVTTSGPGTGVAASLEKISTMKSYLGGEPLGLASGISLENVEGYLPYVNAYLVGTGIESSFGVLDEIKVKDLRQAIEG